MDKETGGEEGMIKKIWVEMIKQNNGFCYTDGIKGDVLYPSIFKRNVGNALYLSKEMIKKLKASQPVVLYTDIHEFNKRLKYEGNKQYEQGKAEERKQFDDFKRALIKRKGKQYKNLQKEILEPCNDGYGKTLSCELRMEAIKSDLGWIAKQEAKKV